MWACCRPSAMSAPTWVSDPCSFVVQCDFLGIGFSGKQFINKARHLCSIRISGNCHQQQSDNVVESTVRQPPPASHHLALRVLRPAGRLLSPHPAKVTHQLPLLRNTLTKLHPCAHFVRKGNRRQLASNQNQNPRGIGTSMTIPSRAKKAIISISILTLR